MKNKIRAAKAVVLALTVAAGVAAAEDGAALYGSKCVGCHTATGAGKPALKGSNLLSDESKKHTDAQLKEAIAAGGAAKKASHAFEKKGVTAGQIDALVAHVRTLQKK